VTSPRVRLVGWRVQPVVMLDDGDTLTPLPVAAKDIPAAEWEQWCQTGHAEALQSIVEQVDAQG